MDPVENPAAMIAMNTRPFVHSDAIRTLLSRARSDMSKAEVPQYGALLDGAADI